MNQNLIIEIRNIINVFDREKKKCILLLVFMHLNISTIEFYKFNNKHSPKIIIRFDNDCKIQNFFLSV